MEDIQPVLAHIDPVGGGVISVEPTTISVIYHHYVDMPSFCP